VLRNRALQIDINLLTHLLTCLWTLLGDFRPRDPLGYSSPMKIPGADGLWLMAMAIVEYNMST